MIAVGLLSGLATGQLSHYLEREVCQQPSSPFGEALLLSCKDLLAQNQDFLREVLRHRTQRYNLFLLSFYRTTLVLPGFSMLPTYNVYTLGILGHFYIIYVGR